MKKQTAVEWLMENLHLAKSPFQQAKAMEKEQIVDFAKICLDKALDLDIRTAHSQVEQYYNETYEK